MVFGFSMAVTWVPFVNQWAEIQSTALGGSSSLPIFSHVALNSLSSMPFIGEPCPINRSGVFFSCSSRVMLNLWRSFNEFMERRSSQIYHYQSNISVSGKVALF